MFFNVEQIIVSFGYTALFAIIFSETGLLIGFFLPGDTLIFTAGILASKGVIGIYETVIICAIAAIIGDSFGYFLGKKYGRGIFKKKGHHFLDEYINKENLERTEDLYEKYGGKIIFIARFIPVVRTIAPTMAGTADMKYSTFLFYNFFGGIAWVVTGILAGYLIGDIIPNSMDIMSVVITLIVFISIAPIAVKYIKRKFHNK